MPGAPLILVVDDDPDLREALRDLLSDEGYQVATASDGIDGLAYLRGHAPPALVLLDWWMPNLHGQGMYEAMRRDQVLSRVPVILVTADDRAAEIAKTAGVEGFLCKPVDADLLLAAVEKYSRARDGVSVQAVADSRNG